MRLLLRSGGLIFSKIDDCRLLVFSLVRGRWDFFLSKSIRAYQVHYVTFIFDSMVALLASGVPQPFTRSRVVIVSSLRLFLGKGTNVRTAVVIFDDCITPSIICFALRQCIVHDLVRQEIEYPLVPLYSLLSL